MTDGYKLGHRNQYPKGTEYVYSNRTPRSAHWMNLIVLLIGAALCHRYSRSGGLSQKFGVGLLLVFSYYILERIGLKMGENGALSPFLAAWISHFLFAGVACSMLYRSFRL